MDLPSHSAQQTATGGMIDPAKAWMVGVVVASDGSLRPAPAADPPRFGRGAMPGGGESLACECPDYCEVDHAAI